MKKVLSDLVIWLIAFIFLGIIIHFLNLDNREKNKDLLIIGYDDTFVPMGFRDSKGNPVGFDIDLAKAVSKAINKEIKFQPIDWTMKETELRNGNIDLIWNGYSINDERKKTVAFSNPYLKDKQVVITKSNREINSLKELKNKSVGVQAASSAMDAISSDKDLLNSIKGGAPILYESNNDALMDLDSGRIDAVVADEVLARYYMNKRGKDKYKVLKEDLEEETYGVGIRKDDKELLNEINYGLNQVIKSGEAKKISEKWFGEDLIYKGES